MAKLRRAPKTAKEHVIEVAIGAAVFVVLVLLIVAAIQFIEHR